MQAIILAAGMGKRLKDLTKETTKCMVKVNGITMIQRMLTLLDKKNLKQIVIVVGYKSEALVNYVKSLKIHTPITFVSNDIYYKTNNIYSLYLARKYLMQDDTLLLESDLVFEEQVLNKIINNPYPSLALVAKFESWMDGTVVELDEENNIKAFHSKKDFKFEQIPNYYKTVNIYKFSRNFSTTHYVPFLEAYCKALGNNEYYEQVLKVIAMLDKPEIKAIRLNNESWYEIDDVQDLKIAECIFADRAMKLKKFQNSYGGYWRYPHIVDFCYLVNPYFPNQKLMDEMKANFERLITNYPSGMQINRLLAAKYFSLHPDEVVVGNGAAELIKSLMNLQKGCVGVILPTFEEYPNRIDSNKLIPFLPTNNDLSYSVSDLMNFYLDKDISALVIINPDNPSGNYIRRNDILNLCNWAANKNISLIIDESFVDFEDAEIEGTLLDERILKNHPNLFVIKSISKCFGVPGLRLGLIASGNRKILERIKSDQPIWNINSFAEFYMQIFEKYKSEYSLALKKFKSIRSEFIKELKTINTLHVIPSQANFVMCELFPPYHATQIAEDLLYDYNIFIKDLSHKKGLTNKQYIRLAIRSQQDNEKLIFALKSILKD